MARNPPQVIREVSSSRHGALLSPGDRSPGRMLSLSAWSEGGKPLAPCPFPPAGGREEDKPAFRLSSRFSLNGLAPGPAGPGGGHRVHRLGGEGGMFSGWPCP